jgi:hypothetical protein
MRIPKNIASLLVDVDPTHSAYLQEDGTILVNVVGALYGLPEAGKLWATTLQKTLLKIGYRQCFDDPCLYQREERGAVSTLCVHVDDVLHTYTTNAKHLRNDLVQKLESEYSEIKKTAMDSQHNISYLGMNICRKTEACADGVRRSGLTITMPNYIEECLVDGNTRGSAPTPATQELFSIDESLPASGDKRAFLAKVMKLMYLARKCRPDILLPCAFLATRAPAPTQEDWNKLARIYRYLNATRDLPLFIAPDATKITAFVDASFAVHADAKGQSGRIIGLGNIGAPAIIKTGKQKLVARSSTEAELISLADSTAEVLMLKRIVEFLGRKPHPVTIYQDNTSAKHMAETGHGGTTGKSKHIAVRYFFIKQHIDNGDIQLKYLPTGQMVADMLTKPLVGRLFISLRQKIMNLPPDRRES